MQFKKRIRRRVITGSMETSNSSHQKNPLFPGFSFLFCIYIYTKISRALPILSSRSEISGLSAAQRQTGVDRESQQNPSSCLLAKLRQVKRGRLPPSLPVHRLSAARGVCTGATFTLANFTKGCGKTPRFVLRSTEGEHRPDTGFLAGSSGLPEGSRQQQLSSLPGQGRPSSARWPHLGESGKGTLEKLPTCGACTPPGEPRGDDDGCPRATRGPGRFQLICIPATG